MLRNLVYGFGLATIFLFSNVVEIVRSTGTTVLHSQLASTSQWVALLLDALLLTAALAVPWWLGLRGKGWSKVRLVLAILLPVVALLGNRLLIANLWFRALRFSHVAMWKHAGMRDIMSPVPYWLVAWIAVVWLLLVVWMSRHSDGTRRVLFNVGKIGLLSGAVLGLNMSWNLARAAMRQAGDTRMAPVYTRDVQAQAGHPRLVWVVMDELSYAQVFEHRVSDLKMPNFDALRSQSMLYTHARPVAYWTELAIPSMLRGVAVDDDRQSYGGIVRFHDTESQTWHRWNPRDTVLGDAENARWNVAVVGWWNPYCALFRGMLQRCFWSDDSPYSPTRPYLSVGQNMAVAFQYPLRPQSQPPALAMRMNENYLLLSHGLSDIRDEQMDFVFLHVPVPHYPFVYDRHTLRDDPRSGYSYQDGLALADKFLGEVMEAARQSPRWANTTIILDGDHSWRTDMWMTEAGWTKEDEVTSGGGKFDDRPLMMVHAPGQTSPETVDAPTPLLDLHGVAESVIKNGKPTLP